MVLIVAGVYRLTAGSVREGTPPRFGTLPPRKRFLFFLPLDCLFPECYVRFILAVCHFFALRSLEEALYGGVV
jgi:hypothetical protein